MWNKNSSNFVFSFLGCKHANQIAANWKKIPFLYDFHWFKWPITGQESINLINPTINQGAQAQVQILAEPSCASPVPWWRRSRISVRRRLWWVVVIRMRRWVKRITWFTPLRDRDQTRCWLPGMNIESALPTPLKDRFFLLKPNVSCMCCDLHFYIYLALTRKH